MIFVLVVLGVVMVAGGVLHNTGLMDLGQVEALATTRKPINFTNATESTGVISSGVSSKSVISKGLKGGDKAELPSPIAATGDTADKSSTAIIGPGLPSSEASNSGVGSEYPYCDQNSKLPKCCSASQCHRVTKSTLFSECCHNILPSGSRPSPIAARKKNPRVKPVPHKIFPLLITATPRSGTVFVQTLLNQLGVKVTNDWNTPYMAGIVSWMHVMKDNHYFSPANIGTSKFRAVWHQVRDPLKSLTSLAFTEPIHEEGKSLPYIVFLKKHVSVTPKAQVLALVQNQKEGFLVWRGMEFYLQWHRFILDLNVPRFRLEDLTERNDMELLDRVFRSMNKPPPDHDKAIRIITKDRRRRQLQRQLHTNHRDHRATLEWPELCRVARDKAQQFLELSHEFGYYLDKSQAC